jgi:hypothetical protein
VAVLARMWFAEKLTVMFSMEAATNEEDETEILEKKGGKWRFFRELNFAPNFITA